MIPEKRKPQWIERVFLTESSSSWSDLHFLFWKHNCCTFSGFFVSIHPGNVKK